MKLVNGVHQRGSAAIRHRFANSLWRRLYGAKELTVLQCTKRDLGLCYSNSANGGIMGNFYCNTLLRGAGQKDVVEELRRLKRTAFVSGDVQGYVLVCDKGCDSQDEREVLKLGTSFSHRFSGPVFSVLNHDDDILLYWLFDKGEVADRYDSTPGYFEGHSRPAEGGNAEMLCQALYRGADRGEVEKILRARQGADYVLAIDRHQALIAALRLPEESLGSSYSYLEKGETFGTVDKSMMVHIT